MCRHVCRVREPTAATECPKRESLSEHPEQTFLREGVYISKTVFLKRRRIVNIYVDRMHFYANSRSAADASPVAGR